MSNPNQPVEGSQGGGVTAGGSSGQAASNVGGDVRQLSVGDLLDLANQQNLDVSALNDLLGQVQVSPEVNVAGQAGGQGGNPDTGQPRPAPQ